MTLLKSRFFIFGSNGFVGNAVALSLEKKGAVTIRVSRQEHDFQSKSLWSGIDQLNENDVLVFAVAQAPVRTFQDFQNNIDIVDNFILNFNDAKFRQIVNISSDAVYADSLSLISEESRVGPNTLHGCMHLVRELALNKSFGESVLHVRPTLIYGPGDPHGGYGPNKFIKDARSIGIITIYGQGEELRDHIFIDDVGEIVAKAVADGVTGIINATSGNVVSFLQIAENIVQQFENVKIQFIPRSSPPPHLGVRRFSSRRLSELMPDYTFTNIEKGINLMNYQIGG